MTRSWLKRQTWVIGLAALSAVSLTASLGFWQLRRADQKLEMQAAMTKRQGLPPLGNADLKALGGTRDVLHQPAVLRGHWVGGATVFLDNRQMNQRQGFYVVTPLRLSGDGRLLLVQRGWVARDFLDRTRVPDVPTPTQVEVEVTGRMAAAPAKVYELGESGMGPIRQNLHVGDVAKALQADVFDGSLVQLIPVPFSPDDGLERHWPAVAVDVHKHHGYAFQWFGLSALIVLLYVWFQIISPRRQPRV
ncbi:MAG: transmembrane cytochrome oxidase [Polaromonas sp.]|nr:transmembrane cytochrome oxidase [Polaromonas sp.]